MLKLVIANKLYSSWSLRPWLVLSAFDIPFEEIVIPLRAPDSHGRVLEYSPSGKVPALVDEDVTVWESMAIIEHLAEAFPDRAIWPGNGKARAHARSIANEMHAGFQPLRQGCPMHLGVRCATPPLTEAMKSSIDRVEDIWSEARNRFAAGGPFLYGAFSAADAMYAPVAARFETYQIPVRESTRAYMNAILAHPAFVRWRQAALAEPWSIPEYASGHTVIESFIEPARPQRC
jgi:glutathione S-transferase